MRNISLVWMILCFDSLNWSYCLWKPSSTRSIFLVLLHIYQSKSFKVTKQTIFIDFKYYHRSKIWKSKCWKRITCMKIRFRSDLMTWQIYQVTSKTTSWVLVYQFTVFISEYWGLFEELGPDGRVSKYNFICIFMV